MQDKLKHKLPIYSIVDHLCIDQFLLTQLREVFTELESEFKSVLDVNKKLCGLHHKLTTSVYDNFFQIALTDSEFNSEIVDINGCEVVHNELNGASISNNMRLKRVLTTLDNSPLNESTYTQLTPTYLKYKEIFDDILSKFKSQPTRIRLVKLAAGTSISPHIDYDPSYAVRIILPIFSTPECVNIFWVKNQIHSTTLEPGKAYFLNTGYKHAVMNFSKHDRYTFMISINGIEDIKHLIEDKINTY